MKRPAPILLTWLCLFVLLPLGAQAQSLTDQTIQSFIDSLKALQSMESELEELTDDMSTDHEPGDMPDFSRVLSSSVEQIKGHEVYERLEDTVQAHGFDSAEQWSRIGDRIFQAWTALEMGDQAGQVNQEMQKAMAEIDNNPHLSEAQKQQMRNMMGGAVSAMQQAADAPEADKQALRPHMDALRTALDADQ